MILSFSISTQINPICLYFTATQTQVVGGSLVVFNLKAFPSCSMLSVPGHHSFLHPVMTTAVCVSNHGFSLPLLEADLGSVGFCPSLPMTYPVPRRGSGTLSSSPGSSACIPPAPSLPCAGPAVGNSYQYLCLVAFSLLPLLQTRG